MGNIEFIDYHKTRDFSQKINATIEFVRQNFKQLSKSLLFIVGPAGLVYGLLAGTLLTNFQQSLFNLTSSSGIGSVMDYFTSFNFWLQVAFAFIMSVITSVITVATINNYIIIYGEKRSPEIAVAEVWERVKDTFFMYLGTVFLFFLLAFAVYVVGVILLIVMMSAVPVLGFLFVLAFIVGLVFAFIGSSLLFIIRGYEKRNFLDSLSRSFFLVKGKWWSTFGLLVVFYIIIYLMSFILMLPLQLSSLINSLHDIRTNDFQAIAPPSNWFALISQAAYYLVFSLLVALPYIGLAFQYFNLVELKESKGLLDRISDLGDSGTPPPQREENY